MPETVTEELVETTVETTTKKGLTTGGKVAIGFAVAAVAVGTFFGVRKVVRKHKAKKAEAAE